jgi:endonuclease-3
VTPALFRLADNPLAMSQLPVEVILDTVRTCGLGPQKSKAISDLSKIIIRNFGGRVPDRLSDLESLPGVGHKTASVVLAQAFGVPAFPVDTHIHRLAQRWGLSSGKNVRQTEADLKKCFAERYWHRLHLQIIYYGREHCSARGCDGTKCEICRLCFPNRKSPKKTRKA